MWLVEDEGGGDEALLYGVDGEAEAFKGVGSEKGRCVVFGKNYQGSHAIAVNRCSGFTVVHVDSPSIREEEPALADRFDSDVSEQG